MNIKFLAKTIFLPILGLLLLYALYLGASYKSDKAENLNTFDHTYFGFKFSYPDYVVYDGYEVQKELPINSYRFRLKDSGDTALTLRIEEIDSDFIPANISADDVMYSSASDQEILQIEGGTLYYQTTEFAHAPRGTARMYVIPENANQALLIQADYITSASEVEQFNDESVLLTYISEGKLNTVVASDILEHIKQNFEVYDWDNFLRSDDLAGIYTLKNVSLSNKDLQLNITNDSDVVLFREGYSMLREPEGKIDLDKLEMREEIVSDNFSYKLPPFHQPYVPKEMGETKSTLPVSYLDGDKNSETTLMPGNYEYRVSLLYDGTLLDSQSDYFEITK